MSELLREVTLAWWNWIAPLSVQAALLILLVGLVDSLLPRRTWPELRAAIWLLVVLRLVLPPGLASPVSLVQWFPRLGTVTAAPLAAEPQRSTVLFWSAAAVVLWLAGVIALLAVGVARRRRLRAFWRRTSAAAAVAPEWFAGSVERTAARLGLRRIPEVRFGTSGAPFVVGLLRPRVYLPLDLLDELRRSEVEHVLVHELAHVRRRDTWIAAASGVVFAIYWFHPFVWLARRRLAALREQCCDRTVARVLREDTAGYRRTLLHFARRMIEAPVGGQRFIAPGSRIVARLRALEHATNERPWLRRASTSVLLGALLIGFVPMARTADEAVGSVAELMERPPGCLQLRFTVLELLAQERAAEKEKR